MDEKIDPKDVADGLAASIDYMRTLLSAAQDKAVFYLENRKLLGPQGELLYICAKELDDLLVLAGRFLDKMDGQVGTAMDLLYGIESPPTAI